MTDTLQEHAGHDVIVHDPHWSGCKDCRRWIDTRPAPEGGEP